MFRNMDLRKQAILFLLTCAIGGDLAAILIGFFGNEPIAAITGIIGAVVLSPICIFLFRRMRQLH